MTSKPASHAEAKLLRDRIDALRLERDALAEGIAETADAYEHECNVIDGNPAHAGQERATELHAALSDYKTRLSRVNSAKAEAEARLADLDRMLNADERAAVALKAVADARKSGDLIDKRIVDKTTAIERMSAMREEEVEAMAAARAQRAAQAVQGLPDDVLSLLGTTKATDKAAPVADPAAHEARADALAAAIAQAERDLQALHADLAAARQGEAEAEAELLRQRAYQAEAAHGEALAAYLPALAMFRAAHELAFGWLPELPGYKRAADDSHGEAMQAARAAARDGVDESALKRGIRKIVAAVGR